MISHCKTRQAATKSLVGSLAELANILEHAIGLTDGFEHRNCPCVNHVIWELLTRRSHNKFRMQGLTQHAPEIKATWLPGSPESQSQLGIFEVQ